MSSLSLGRTWIAMLLWGVAALTCGQAFTAKLSKVSMIEGVPSPVLIATGDLNGDGDLDLAVAEATVPRNRAKGKPIYRLHLLHQKSGGFSMPPDKSLDLLSSPSGLVVGDFDRDGKNDIAVGIRSRRNMALYLGAEDFGKARYCEYNNDSGARSFCAGRINSRGHVDFMSGAAWRKWMGGDRFDTGYFCSVKRNDNFISTLADLNWDGLDDVIFTVWAQGSPKGEANLIRIYYGPFFRMGLIGPDAAGEVVTLSSPLSESDRPALGKILVGDLNGDDQSDLILPAGRQTLVYSQNSPIGFTDGAGPSLALDDAVVLLADDLDGNGLCDLVFRSADGKSLLVWRQAKDRPFSADWSPSAHNITLPQSIRSLAADDMDGDETKELFAGLAHGGILVLAECR